MQQDMQNTPSPQTQLSTWNPHIILQTEKTAGPTPESESNPIITEESVNKFLEIGTRVVVTTATAWWTLCELMDYLKLKSAEVKAAKERNGQDQTDTSTSEVLDDEQQL